MSHSQFLLELQESAIADTANGYNWYQEQKAGLGEDFVVAVRQGLDRIVKNPYHYSKVNEKFRRFKLSKFPYIIIYKIGDGLILVVAVIHSRRKQAGRFRA